MLVLQTGNATLKIRLGALAILGNPGLAAIGQSPCVRIRSAERRFPGRNRLPVSGIILNAAPRCGTHQHVDLLSFKSRMP